MTDIKTDIDYERKYKDMAHSYDLLVKYIKKLQNGQVWKRKESNHGFSLAKSRFNNAAELAEAYSVLSNAIDSIKYQVEKCEEFKRNYSAAWARGNWGIELQYTEERQYLNKD